VRIGSRRAADLYSRKVLQSQTERQVDKRPIPRRHVRRSIERRGACEQVRMARDEKERLLSAHAAAEGVQATPVDMEPGQRVLRDLRHARQIADLARIAPRNVSARPCPSGLITAKPPTAGSRPQRRMFSCALTPRPCGEITSGIAGWSVGPYHAGRSTYARRGSPSCAR